MWQNRPLYRTCGTYVFFAPRVPAQREERSKMQYNILRSVGPPRLHGDALVVVVLGRYKVMAAARYSNGLANLNVIAVPPFTFPH